MLPPAELLEPTATEDPEGGGAAGPASVSVPDNEGASESTNVEPDARAPTRRPRAAPAASNFSKSKSNSEDGRAADGPSLGAPSNKDGLGLAARSPSQNGRCNSATLLSPRPPSHDEEPPKTTSVAPAMFFQEERWVSGNGQGARPPSSLSFAGCPPSKPRPAQQSASPELPAPDRPLVSGDTGDEAREPPRKRSRAAATICAAFACSSLDITVGDLEVCLAGEGLVSEAEADTCWAAASLAGEKLLGMLARWGRRTCQ